MKSIRIHVGVGNEIRPVELTFATESEVRRVREWRKRHKSSDASEFAALAAKRWFYYARQRAAVTSINELRSAIRRDERAEVAFLMGASAEWANRYRFLALAYCRRTWCNHLALDFLAVRPGITFKNLPIRGLGSGLVYGLVSLADSLGIKAVWGEATASSARFYEKALQIRQVEDLFVVRRDAMRGIQDHYMKNLRNRLAKGA